MKKILFSLVCVLTCFSIVSAKTQIEYDWGKFEEFEIRSANIYKNDLAMFKLDSDNWKEYFSIFKNNNKDEKLIPMYENDISYYTCGTSEDFYIFSDVIMSIVDDCGAMYQVIYDDELNMVDYFEIDYWNDYDTYAYGETDKYYYIGLNMFDKKTRMLVDEETLVSSHELYSLYLEKNESNYIEAEKIYFNIIKDIFPGTHYALDYFVYLNDFEDRDVEKYFYNGTDGYAISFYDYNIDQFGIEFYDKDFNVIKTIVNYDYTAPYVLFKDNSFYVFEVKAKQPVPRDVDYDNFYYFVTEYDYQFNKKDEFNLSSLTNEDAINLKFNYGRYFRDIFAIEDGFIVLTDVYVIDSISENKLQMYYPAIQKFSFVYDVKTKESENGIIKVDKDSSKNGDKITYTVEPKEGYKLDKVIVTDENGNTIEIKDSSFTMPSANVTIEAIFVVENPNTGVFINVGCACIVALISYYYIVQKNIRVKQYE